MNDEPGFTFQIKNWRQAAVAAVVLVVVIGGVIYLQARRSLGHTDEARQRIEELLQVEAGREALKTFSDDRAPTEQDAQRFLSQNESELLELDARATFSGQTVFKVTWRRGKNGGSETTYYRGEYSSLTGWEGNLRKATPYWWNTALIRF